MTEMFREDIEMLNISRSQLTLLILIVPALIVARQLNLDGTTTLGLVGFVFAIGAIDVLFIRQYDWAGLGVVFAWASAIGTFVYGRELWMNGADNIGDWISFVVGFGFVIASCALVAHGRHGLSKRAAFAFALPGVGYLLYWGNWLFSRATGHELIEA